MNQIYIIFFQDEVKVNGDSKVEENGKDEPAKEATPVETVTEIKTKKTEPETPAVAVEVQKFSCFFYYFTVKQFPELIRSTYSTPIIQF